jgi:hypothetical protein
MTKTQAIKKVKVNDAGGLYVEYDGTKTFQEKEGKETLSSSVIKDCQWRMHTDLIKAWDAFVPHLILLCEEDGEMWTLEDFSFEGEPDAIKMLPKYKVTGVTLGGSGEHLGITVVGQKKLRGGKVLNLVAPFTKFEDESDAAYIYQSDLLEAWDLLRIEALAYMDGKRTPIWQQQEMFTDVPEEKKPLKQLRAPQRRLKDSQKMITSGEHIEDVEIVQD